MKINDIHTHNLLRDNAIISVTPDKWNPKPDKYYSVGLHPWKLTEEYDEQWKMAAEIINESSQVVAVGETGIDRVRGISVEVQMQSVTRHISLSEMTHKPLILHCVRATSDILHLHKISKHKQPWIIHGFRGNKSIAKQLFSEGIYISIGERYNIEALRAIPDDKLLIESDESTLDIDEIYEAVATDRGVSVEALKTKVQENISRIWGSSLTPEGEIKKRADRIKNDK